MKKFDKCIWKRICIFYENILHTKYMCGIVCNEEEDK